MKLFWKEHIPQCVVIFSFLVCLFHQPMNFSMARMSSLNFHITPVQKCLLNEWWVSEITTYCNVLGANKRPKERNPWRTLWCSTSPLFAPTPTYSFSSNYQCKTQSQDQMSLYSDEKIKNCDARKEMILKKNNDLSILSFYLSFTKFLHFNDPIGTVACFT